MTSHTNQPFKRLCSTVTANKELGACAHQFTAQCGWDNIRSYTPCHGRADSARNGCHGLRDAKRAPERLLGRRGVLDEDHIARVAHARDAHEEEQDRDARPQERQPVRGQHVRRALREVAAGDGVEEGKEEEGDGVDGHEEWIERRELDAFREYREGPRLHDCRDETTECKSGADLHGLHSTSIAATRIQESMAGVHCARDHRGK